MSTLLTLTAQVLLDVHRITDAASCRAFLNELMLFVRARAMATETQLDDTQMHGIMFVLNNDGLFRYVYRLIDEQFQTPEILFESADTATITGLVEDAATQNTKSIDPVVIISLVSQIISFINSIKDMKNKTTRNR